MPEFDEAYYIDAFTLALLLNRKGLNRVYCMDFFGDRIDISDEDACKAMFEASSEGLIKVDENEKFYLNETLEVFCNIITSSKTVIGVYSNSQAASVIYIGKDNSVIAHPANNRKNVLKMFKTGTSQIYDYIDKQKVEISKYDEESSLFVESLEFMNLYDDFQMIINNSATSLFIDIFDTASEASVLKCAIICSEGQEYLCSWDSQNYSIEKYEKANYLKNLE